MDWEDKLQHLLIDVFIQMRGNKEGMKATISASQEKMETAISIGQEGLRAIHESLMGMLNANHQEIVATIRAGQEEIMAAVSAQDYLEGSYNEIQGSRWEFITTGRR
jgi:ERCC4-related helicase